MSEFSIKKLKRVRFSLRTQQKSEEVKEKSDLRRRFTNRRVPIKRKTALIVKKVDNGSESSSDSEKEHTYNVDHDAPDMTLQRRKSKRLKTLKELIQPMSEKLLLQNEIKRLSYLAACFGCGSKRVSFSLRVLGTLIWLFSLTIHFAFDIYEAAIPGKGYGYTFIAAQGIWFLTFLILTFATGHRSMIRLDDGLRELRHQECYEKTLTKLMEIWRKYPYIILAFGFLSSSIQHLFLYIDNALHLDMGFQLRKEYKYILHGVRYLSGVHVYAAYLTFWLIPLSIILMTGYSMQEYNDQTGAKMRDKNRVFTFKEAISSYSTRAKFVKESSSQNSMILTILLVTGIICFGINAYVFLFKDRLYLHVWHSLVPLGVMIVPLCATAWVTKQYSSFIIVVVKAWVHRDDLDESSSDEDSGIEDPNNNKPKISTSGRLSPSASFLKNSRFVKRFSFHVDKKSKFLGKKNADNINKQNKDGDSKANLKSDESLAPWQKEIIKVNPEVEDTNKKKLNFPVTVKTLTKFKAANKIKPRFNFEKFLSYLESMRNVVGFEIGGIMMTWDKVSTTLFFLFSIVAVFMQESIFGSASTVI